MTNRKRKGTLFYREQSRLQRLKTNKEATIEHLETKKNMVILVENKPEEINKEKQNNEDEQWEINEKNAIRQLRRRRLSMKQLKKYLIMMLQNNSRTS
jgi:hypothetical protein